MDQNVDEGFILKSQTLFKETLTLYVCTYFAVYSDSLTFLVIWYKGKGGGRVRGWKLKHYFKALRYVSKVDAETVATGIMGLKVREQFDNFVFVVPKAGYEGKKNTSA